MAVFLTWWDVHCHAFSSWPAQSSSRSWRHSVWPQLAGSPRSSPRWTRHPAPPGQWRSSGACIPAGTSGVEFIRESREEGNNNIYVGLTHCSLCRQKLWINILVYRHILLDFTQTRHQDLQVTKTYNDVARPGFLHSLGHLIQGPLNYFQGLVWWNLRTQNCHILG